jgi:hypothetical protein
MVVTVESPLRSLTIDVATVSCETPQLGVVVVTRGMTKVEGVVCCWVSNVAGVV